MDRFNLQLPIEIAFRLSIVKIIIKDVTIRKVHTIALFHYTSPIVFTYII